MYFWIVLYLAAVYIRPGELMPSLAEVPLLNYVSIGALVATLLSLAMKPRAFLDRPQDKVLLVFYLAIILSNPANGWIGGAIEGATIFFPVLFFYFITRIGIRSEKQINGFIRVFVWLNVFLAVNGLMQVFFGTGFGQVEAMEQGDVIRIMGTGIFNDPNDLGMTLVMAVPFVLTMIFGPNKRVIGRVVGAIILVTLVAACFYSNSRGTMLGLGVVFAWFIYRRHGLTAAATLGVLGFVAILAFGPSRMSEISSDEESAQGRIQAWSEGMQMFKSRPILGVGFRQFAEFNRMVAHNGFVHVTAELGIVGSTAFVGMFFWHFMTLRALRRRKEHPSRLPEDVSSCTVGMLTCLVFLSRQYVIVPYIPLVLSGCLAGAMGTDPDTEGNVAKQSVQVVALTIGLIGVFYVIARVFGNY